MTINIRILGFLLILTFGQFAFGQTNFNYQRDITAILEKTKDTNDNLFYDKLLSRFTLNDTTLSDFEVLALLIGYTDKPAFKPYQYLNKEREIYKLNDEGKYQEALDTANLFLQKCPLSQQAIIEKSYSFHKLGNRDSSHYYSYQFDRIMMAMHFSGNGETKETPIFALGPADGQNYISKFMGVKIGTMGSGRDSNGNFLDMLEAKFSNGKSVTLYFIIQHATKRIFLKEESKNVGR